jgi:O-antigen/teichoic acid export membrane protein
MTRSSTRRTTGNAVSLLASDVANRAATFVLYALVARYVGASDFGRMSLALTFFYVFQTFAVAGLKTLIIREVAKDRTKTAQYLVNGSAVVVVTSLVSISILLLSGLGGDALLRLHERER